MQNQDEIDWDSLYTCLYAFVDKLLKKQRWFRKTDDGSAVKGKQVHDYVSDGIERYLTSPEKHDPARGKLEDYIKYNIIRGMVSNDADLAENKKNLDVFTVKHNDDTNDVADYQEAMLPFVEALVDQQLDYDLIMPYIEEQVKDDAAVENVFLGITMNLKRRDIMEEFQMSEQEYDNAVRRLSTIQKNIAKKFYLEKA